MSYNMHGADLSIVIVNWNSTAWLRMCLPTIREVCGIRLETIVVDNASSDGSQETIRKEFPWVILIPSAVNLGFAGANNLGFRHSQGRYILFLNPDTEVIGDALQRMCRFLDSYVAAGIVGAKLLNTDGSVQTSCVQTFPTITNQVLDAEVLRRWFPRLRLWGMRPLLDKDGDNARVEVISGACMMVRREVFGDVGGFTTSYFMYAEDADLCFKIKRRGWEICYVGSAEVVHHGGGTSTGPEGNPKADVVMRESIHTFFKLHRSSGYAFAYRCCIGLAAMVRILVVLVMLPIERRHAQSAALRRAWSKWKRIFRWAVGLETWARSRPSQLGESRI